MRRIDPISFVLEYFAALGPTKDAFWKSFETYFDDRTVWENVGLARTIGRAEAIAFARQFPVEFEYMTVEVLHIGMVDDVVFTERVDYFHDGSDAIAATIRVAGTFTVDGEHIREWRDYYDTAGLAAK